MQCDICGKDKELVIALIEGTEINVCNDCAKFGKTIKKIRPEQKKKQLPSSTGLAKEKILEKEKVSDIVENYASIIRNAREKLGLTQKEFAKKINEKLSMVHNLETGKHEPSLKLAEKLEKILHIKLIEEYEEEKPAMQKSRDSAFTLGDFISIKKK